MEAVGRSTGVRSGQNGVGTDRQTRAVTARSSTGCLHLPRSFLRSFKVVPAAMQQRGTPDASIEVKVPSGGELDRDV